jgi:tetratricopeptide (TPR) repeat protein
VTNFLLVDLRRTKAVLTLVFLLIALAFPPAARAASTPPALPTSAAVDAARAQVAAGDQAGAMRDLASYLPQHAEDVAAARLLGDLYFRLPDYKRAETTWRTILVRVPGDVGYLEDAAGDWKSAVSKYAAALAADPLQVAAYVDLGFDYSEHRFYTLAEAAYIKGLSVEPGNGRLHYLLAVAYNLEGKIGLAREQYRQAIAAKDDAAVARAAETERAQLPRP